MTAPWTLWLTYYNRRAGPEADILCSLAEKAQFSGRTFVVPVLFQNLIKQPVYFNQGVILCDQVTNDIQKTSASVFWMFPIIIGAPQADL